LGEKTIFANAGLEGKLLTEICTLDKDAQDLLIAFADKHKLSARAYHRTLRLARTIADLQNESNILKLHIAEALSYRQSMYF
jgi:magnesium chelatase family protein